jgi:hypothetical protein
MSLVSGILNQRLRPASGLPGGVLMRWDHEPVALYQRKRQGVFYLIWPFLPFGACAVLFPCHPHGMKNFPFLIFLAIALIVGAFITLIRQLPSRQLVELTEEGVRQRFVQSGGGGSLLSSAYKDIESCMVSRESCKGATYSVLKFKNRHKLVTITGPVTLVLVPEDINSGSVLQILRDKGVRIFEG